MNTSTHNKKITKKEKFLWILLCSVLDFIVSIIYVYNSIVKDDYIVLWPTNILLLSLFAYLLLKMKLYKHHYLSIIIITIIGIAYNLISENFNLDKLKMNYKFHINNFFVESIFNILYILYKFFMLKKYINLYSILFFQGLIELVLGIITLIITTKYFKSFDSFYTYIDGIDGTEIGLFIGLVFVNFLSSIVLYIIIDIFSPFHIFLVGIFSQIILFFVDENIDSKINITIICSIFLVLCLFMSLIFIEIIQLNFCGLSTMTKKNIEERARIDSMLNDENGNDEDIKENNKKEKSENIDEKRISIKGYSVELNELSIDKNTPILTSDLYSVE